MTVALKMDFITFLVYFLAVYVVLRFLYRLFFAPGTKKKKIEKKDQKERGSALPEQKAVGDVFIGTVKSLYVHPIKSCKGVSVDEAIIGSYGFDLDRLFVLARDSEEEEVLSFVTLRNLPRLSLLSVSLEKGDVVVSMEERKDLGKLRFPIRVGAEAEQVVVRVWSDELKCVAVSKEADDWFSQAIGVSLRLLRMGPKYSRPYPIEYAREHCVLESNLADLFPYLLTSTSSLDQVNELSSEPIEMERFRPNIVVDSVTGTKPFEEDLYAQLAIGSATFFNVKCCSRCKVPRLSLVDGTESVKQEPTRSLEELGHYHKDEAYFGVNLVHKSGLEGTKISVGQKVVVKTKYVKPLQEMSPPKKN